MHLMISTGDDSSPPERDRTAGRRWMIGISLSLVFGLFGAVMALLSYMDRHPTERSPAVAPGASRPAAPAASSGDSEPAKGDKGKGNDRK